jgi:hypothetical protein
MEDFKTYLAYLFLPSVTKKKAFINLTLRDKGIKLFSSSLMAGINKLDCSPMKRFRDLSSVFFLAISDEEKSFLNFDTWCQTYKTFFFITNGRYTSARPFTF